MGEFFALLSAVCFATANITISRGSASGDVDNGAFLSILLTAALACLAMLIAGRMPLEGDLNFTGLAWFALAGVLTAFVGRVFLFASVLSLGAMRASAVKRLNPFFAVILGGLVLGETLGGWMIPGMILIFASFLLLAREAWRRAAMQSGTPQIGQANARISSSIFGLGYGAASALAYAIGYLARKQGLNEIANPYLGTAIGAVAGIAAYVLASALIPGYRQSIVNTFTRFNRWFYITGALASFGQLCYFLALSHISVSRVALISSLEVFVTIFLSLWIFRARDRLSMATLAAACLGVAGTALILV